MGFVQKFSSRKSPDDPIQDIMKNLRCILNTKKDYGSMLPSLGIGDYNAHHSRSLIIDTIIKEIQENIRLYEPRVHLIEIKEVSSQASFRIRFELKCEIVDYSKPLFLIFDSVHDHVMVEG